MVITTYYIAFKNSGAYAIYPGIDVSKDANFISCFAMYKEVDTNGNPVDSYYGELDSVSGVYKSGDSSFTFTGTCGSVSGSCTLSGTDLSNYVHALNYFSITDTTYTRLQVGTSYSNKSGIATIGLGKAYFSNAIFYSGGQKDYWDINDLSGVSASVAYSDNGKMQYGSTNTATFTISSSYLTGTVSQDCTIVDDNVTKVILSLSKDTYEENESLTWQTGDTLTAYDSSNNALQSWNGSDIANAVSATSGSFSSTTDGAQTLTHTFKYKTSLTFARVLYANFSLATLVNPTYSSTKTSYVWSKNTTAFDFTNLSMQEERHANSSSGTAISYIDHTIGGATYPLSLVSNGNETIDYANARYYALTFSCSNQYGKSMSYTFSASSHVWYGEPLRVVNIALNATTDYKGYWDNGVDTFHFPTSGDSSLTTFAISYNDSQFDKTISADDSSIAYYNGTPLTTSSVINKNWNSVSFLYTDSTNVANGNSAITYSGSYSIIVSHDYVESVAVVSSPTIIKGNYLSSFKSNFSITATYKSGEVTNTNWSNWSFAYVDILSPSVSSNYVSYANGTLTIKDNDSGNIAHSDGFSLSNIVFANPTLSEIVPSAFATTYNNKSDTINLSKVTATKKYSDAVYESVTSSTAFEATPTGGSNVLSINSNDTTLLPNTMINGTSALSVDMGTSTEVNPSVTFTAKNDFDTSKTISYVSSLSIIEITDIRGISFANDPYTNYKVGDAFLNDADTTKIIVYYVDSSSVKRSLAMYLKDGLSTLNIYPLKGTKLANAVTSKEVTITSAFNANVSLKYDISVSNNVSYNANNVKFELRPVKIYSAVSYKANSKEDGTVTIPANSYIFVEVGNTKVNSDGSRSLANGLALAASYTDTKNVRIYGFVNLETGNDHITFFNDYIPLVGGASNIVVTFPHYDAEAESFIDKMRFGCKYGHNNSTERLWLSGNKDYQNYDCHSCEPNQSNYDGAESIESSHGDFSYFSYRDEAKYGESDNAVVGYDIVSESKLLVLKNHSNKEPSVYFRVPERVQWIDWMGVSRTDVQGNALYEEQYSLAPSNSPISGISPQTIANFNGDTLFVDYENEVAGLDIEGIVGDSQRQANTRSYFIDKVLRTSGLSSSILWTNGRSLYLSAPNVGLFVSDRDSKSNGQYEWWKLDDAEATCFADVFGNVVYGDGYGNIYLLEGSAYDDKKRIFADDGDLLAVNAYSEGSNDNAVIVASYSIIGQMSDDSDYYFKPVYPSSDLLSHLFRKLGTISSTLGEGDIYLDKTNGVLAVTNAFVDKLLRINKTYYLNNADGKTYVTDKNDSVYNFLLPYQLRQIEDFVDYGYPYYNAYKLVSPSHELNLKTASLVKADLVEEMTGEYKIVGTSYVNKSFRLSDENNNIIDITKYSSQPANLSINSVITKYTPVTSLFVTAPLFNDSMSYFKTVWKIDITNGSEKPSDLSLAYVSNKVPSEYAKTIADVSKASLGLNLNDFDFSKTDFDKKSVPRYYTIQRTMPRIKSICFAFESNRNSNSVLPGIEVMYSIPMPSKGSD